MKRYRGFTLIEVMIVVTIVGILSAIAMPAYRSYVIHTQLTGALAEITVGKSGYELLVLNGEPDTQFTALGLGLPDNSQRCSRITVNVPVEGASASALQCELNGDPAIATGILNLSRTAGGTWLCDIFDKPAGWKDAYMLVGCTL